MLNGISGSSILGPIISCSVSVVRGFKTISSFYEGSTSARLPLSSETASSSLKNAFSSFSNSS